MLLVANLAKYKLMQKTKNELTEPLAHGYTSEISRRELSNEYQHEVVFVVLF